MRRLPCLIGLHDTNVHIHGNAAYCARCGKQRLTHTGRYWQRP